MAERNEAVVRTLVEGVLNRGQTTLLNTLVATGHIGHHPLGDHYGPEGMRIVISELRTAFPDLTLTIEDLIAAKDKVVWRFGLRATHGGTFMGLQPTGRAVVTDGIAIGRLVDGQFAETWVNLDVLGLLRQIGGFATFQEHS